MPCAALEKGEALQPLFPVMWVVGCRVEVGAEISACWLTPKSAGAAAFREEWRSLTAVSVDRSH